SAFVRPDDVCPACESVRAPGQVQAPGRARAPCHACAPGHARASCHVTRAPDAQEPLVTSDPRHAGETRPFMTRWAPFRALQHADPHPTPCPGPSFSQDKCADLLSTTVSLSLIGLVLVAAVIQRVAGLGLGMIFAPYAVVLIGAHEGIMLANFLGTLMPVLLLPRIWSQIEWHKVWWLSLPAVAVMPAAAWVSSISPPGPLYIVVALLVLASLV